ncbi:rod shape-determining protein MreC [Rhodovibrionaceae bacterium A322]
MTKRENSVLHLAAPLKYWAQRFALALLFSVTVALMLFGRTDGAMVNSVRDHVVDAMSPILGFVSQPVQSVNRAIDNGRELVGVKHINEQLRAEVARLSEWHQRALRLEGENAALREMLNVKQDPGLRFVTGRVIADQGGAYVRSVLVNVGLNDGVNRGQAAMTGEGFAGRVASVGNKASRVLLITDINSRIPVVVGPARDRAVLAGDNSNRPVLEYLSPATSISPGDTVMTSGHGGVLPAGLAVGVVVSSDDGGVRVRPYVDWDHMEYLRLVDYGLPGILKELE